MNMFRLWRLFHRSAPAHIQPRLCAGHRCLRIRHRRLPNRARRPAWLHLAGLRRPHVRLHDQFQQVRARYIRNMVQNPGARRQARRHGRRRPLDGRPGHSRHEHLFRRLCAARRIRQSATHRAVRGARRLGGRLAASRRDARLAALRLAGATTAQVTKLTALDAGARLCLARWSAWPATSR